MRKIAYTTFKDMGGCGSSFADKPLIVLLS